MSLSISGMQSHELIQCRAFRVFPPVIYTAHDGDGRPVQEVGDGQGVTLMWIGLYYRDQYRRLEIDQPLPMMLVSTCPFRVTIQGMHAFTVEPR